jgi:uncharacterized protein
VKVAGEHSFGVPPQRIWEALHDARLLAAALPGARRLEPTGEDEYAITVDVGVGSIKGTYDGTFALVEQRAPEACTVRAIASGRPGSVQAVARMRLSERDGGALMAYEADATLSGPLAGVGQRLVGAAARRTTEQFLGELERVIAAPPGAPPAPVPERVVARGGADPRVIAASALAGAAVALLGVAVGRWTAQRR